MNIQDKLLPPELKEPETIVRIPTSELTPNRVAPAKFVASVREHGFFQPVILVMRGENEWKILDGNQRVSAAQQCQGDDPYFDTMMAIVTTMPELQGLNAAMITSEHRSRNFVAELEALENQIALLVKDFETEAELLKEVARALHLNHNRLKQLYGVYKDLDVMLKAEFKRGNMSWSVAVAASKLPPKKQQEYLVPLIGETKITMKVIADAKRAKKQAVIASLQSLFGEPLPETKAEPENKPVVSLNEVTRLQNDVLKALEWNKGGLCPYCAKPRLEGHSKGCELERVIQLGFRTLFGGQK
jgi:hypothetical protein